jgi:hypothetical protein
VRDDLGTDGPPATDEMAGFGAHPQNGSRELAGGLCDSLTRKGQCVMQEYEPCADLRNALWPTSFALKELTAAEEARIGALVKKAVS